MLKIILLGEADGLVSSRKIATACETNILFMSLSADVQPHYTSVASFCCSYERTNSASIYASVDDM